MKHIKMYEKIDFDKFKIKIGLKHPADNILDELFKDIDESKIKMFTYDNNNTSKIEYEKNNIKYIITASDENSSEFGPSTRFSFYINNEYTKVSLLKLRKLYNSLSNKYGDFQEDINKYNL